MKFLILTDDSARDPKNEAKDLEVIERWVDEAKESGFLEAIYSLAGNHGTAMIVNAADHEQLDTMMYVSKPLCEGTKYQVIPLADHSASISRLKALARRGLASLKKSESSSS